MSNLDLTGKHARWALALQEYDFTITHQPKVTHQNVDVPSRYPQSSSLDLTGARMDVVPTPVALTTSLVSSSQTWEQAAQWSVT